MGTRKRVGQESSAPHRTGGRVLSPEHLVEDFGRKAGVARRCVRTLFEVLCASDSREVDSALARWQGLAASSYGQSVTRATTSIQRLTGWLEIAEGHGDPRALLFALQTYYALVVKMLTWQILAALDRSPNPAERLASGGNDQRLREEIVALENGPGGEARQGDGSVSDGCFDWYTAAWSPAVQALVCQLAERFCPYEVERLLDGTVESRDLLKPLYEDLFPKTLRHALGEYYTPDWLAEHVLDQAGYRGDPGARLLDPACGSGTFLVAALKRIRAWLAQDVAEDKGSRRELCRRILDNVVGFDLNPLAVLSARANYLIALGDLARSLDHRAIPVFRRDSILDPCDATGPAAGRFDYVVGNPPWIAWDDLPADYRTATRPLWEEYGLFTLSASDARHGGAKKDLSMLMVYTAADRYLADRGCLAMVITQTLFQTRGAGDGFRRFRLGSDGPPLRVVRVDDLVARRPFATAANWTSTLVLEKGSPTVYPVPYVRWGKTSSNGRGDASRVESPQTFFEARPIDPDRPTSPWFLQPRGLAIDLQRRIGPSEYCAHLGANTGGANGVYWLELLAAADGGVRVRNLVAGARRSNRTEPIETVLEPDLLYPLLRWGDIARYHARPSAHLLLVQDPQTRRGVEEDLLREAYPRTYAYLKRFEPMLLRRAAYRRYHQQGTFYSMYDIDHYTLAPIKVVWRRMDRRINAAVVTSWEDPLLGRRPVVPQETCVLVACQSAAEAYYLCALLNSAVVGFLVGSHSVCGGKGFGTPGMLDVLGLRRFTPADPCHEQLAVLGRQAHEAVQSGREVEPIQEAIDALAGLLWGLEPDQVRLIRRSADLPIG